MNKNQFQPCMFVRYSKNDGEPHGFISTYADEKHIYRGSGQDFPPEVGTVPDKVSVYMKDYLDNIDETKSISLLQDEDGNSVDSKYFKQDRFFTTGGTLGVFFCKCISPQSVQVYENGTLDWDYVPAVDIVLSRPSMKNNPDDESYRDYGTGKFKDYFLYTGLNKTSSEKKYGGTYLYLNDEEKNLNNETHDDYWDHWLLYPYDDKKPQYETTSPFWILKGTSYHQSANKYPFQGEANLIVKNGWMAAPNCALAANERDLAYQVANTLVTGKELFYLNNKLQSNGDDYKYQLYVGRQRVFASIKGEGGEDASGKGSTLTIKKNQLKIIKEATYTKPDQSTGHADGVVLPETSRIVIEEGGVLSVEGNFINNGTIENNGGTIIIKDGGCISPFGDTGEGTIKSVGGTVIVMPKGKLFCLVDDLAKTREAPPLSMYSSDNQACGLINFGLAVISRALVDKASKIENRNGGTLLVAHRRTDSSVLFYNEKVTGSGQDTSVKGIAMVSPGDSSAWNYSIHGAIDGVRPTLVNEKKATFVYKISEVNISYVDDNDEKQVYHIDGIDYSKGKEGVSDGFTIFTPAY